MINKPRFSTSSYSIPQKGIPVDPNTPRSQFEQREIRKSPRTVDEGQYVVDDPKRNSNKSYSQLEIESIASFSP